DCQSPALIIKPEKEKIMNNTESNNDLSVTDVMSQFEKCLVDSTLPKGPLWYAWHYLQVYSFWGLRIAYTETSLKSLLGISDPLAYDFFGPMVEAYTKIHDGAKGFSENIFPAVVKLGDDLTTFATRATSKAGGDGMFSAISDCLNGKNGGQLSDAVQILSDLQMTATKNAQNAENVLSSTSTYSLSAYHDALVDADNELQNVQKQIEADDKSSQKKIHEITGTGSGSLADLMNNLKSDQDEYQHDVIVASTTPTYGWVYPFGTICAATVAAVYGTRAVQM